ncbi:MAG: esterase [Syntrophothermus sp.]
MTAANRFRFRFTPMALLFLIFSTGYSSAQTAKNDYTIKGWWTGQASPFSPVVHSDRHITFRFKAPHAARVELNFGEWDVKGQAMKKDTSGIWTITIGPVEPEIYGYTFNVDGTTTLDFENPKAKIGQTVFSSVVEVPGNPPRFDEIQNVPHGSLHIVKYISNPLKRLRSVYVYTPPDYAKNSSGRYPVLYLRHGGGDTEASWSQDGCAGTILENLIAGNKAVPMIIVMTNGMTDGSWAGGSTPEAMTLLENELIGDVIPLIEKNFRVKEGSENRAIAGLSMGGGQAFVMGLHNQKKFAWIGEFSSGLLSAAEFDLDKIVPEVLKDSSAVNKNVRLLWVACGKNDPRYNGHLNLSSLLNSRGIHHEFHDMPGGHEWKVWRHQLNDFMQRIFRK